MRIVLIISVGAEEAGRRQLLRVTDDYDAFASGNGSDSLAGRHL